jgi:signal transduction histidine kinase/DNA-binding response OmpR family regulator
VADTKSSGDTLSLSFAQGGGELGERIRCFDWTSTPLGPLSYWPNSLKTAVRIMLTTRQPIWIGWGPELHFLYNDPYCAILGGKHPTMLGQPTRVVWNEIWPVIEPMLRTVTTKGEGVYRETQLLIMERHGYSEETYYTFSYSPLPDDHGGIGGMICTNVLDTPRVIEERQMATLRDVSTAAGAKTWEQAAKDTLVQLRGNPQDLLFGLLYRASENESLFSLTGAEGFGADGLPAPREIGKGGPWEMDKAFADGSIRVIELPAASSYSWPQGAWDRPATHAAVLPLPASGSDSLSCTLVIGLNPYRLFDDNYRRFLTLLGKQATSNLAAAHAYESEKRRGEELAELDRAKTTFFSNVSHEFRTPLTLMLGPLQEWAQGGAAPQKDELAMVHRNGLRLLKLVNTLLDFSRTEARHARADPRPVNISQLTGEVASAFRSAIEQAGITLVVDCPKIAGPVLVDPEHWEKIVLNLVSNAYKFTLRGEIRVSLRRMEETVLLEVADTGTGIPPDALPRLFERFYRVENSGGRTFEGSGIGLALVAELARLHGGTASVRSELGRGSVFTVAIPFRPALEAAATAMPFSTDRLRAGFIEEAVHWANDPPNGTTTSTAAATNAPRILLADDNSDMRGYIERLLGSAYRVEAVGDGEAALASALRDPPDLILSDVMMPRLDGLGLVRALRGNARLNGIPVILVSARAGEESLEGALDTGADDYLYKPFSVRELLARVSAQIKIAAVRRASLAAVSAERGRLSVIIDQLPVAVGIGNAQGDIIHMNRAALELHGFTSSEEMFTPIGDYHRHFELRSLEGEVLPSNAWPVARALRGEPTVALRFRMLNPSRGVNRVISCSVVPLRTADGDPEYVYVMQDLTELMRTAASLREARDAAESASRAKDKFLAVLSHELRTPLAPIALTLSALDEDPEVPAKLKQELDMMRRNMALEVNLIDDLLDLSRITSGKLRLQKQSVAVHQILHHAVTTSLGEGTKKGVEVAEDFRAQHDQIEADPARMQQVFWNLLRNALKFSPPGSRIEVRTLSDGSRLTVEVQDSGVGIASDMLSKIFEAFEQGDETRARQFGGLGLGLAIAKAIVERHDGTITAASEGPGRGAVFAVSLPLVPVGSQGGGLVSADSATPSIIAPLRLLLVEDHLDTAITLETLLRRSGYQVFRADSVAAARLVAQQSPLDLVISDLGLPDGTGHSLMAELRDRYGLPGIALSGYGMEEDLRESRQAGFVEHITKPANITALRSAIRRIVEANLASR